MILTPKPIDYPPSLLIVPAPMKTALADGAVPSNYYCSTLSSRSHLRRREENLILDCKSIAAHLMYNHIALRAVEKVSSTCCSQEGAKLDCKKVVAHFMHGGSRVFSSSWRSTTMENRPHAASKQLPSGCHRKYVSSSSLITKKKSWLVVVPDDSRGEESEMRSTKKAESMPSTWWGQTKLCWRSCPNNKTVISMDMIPKASCCYHHSVIMQSHNCQQRSRHHHV